MEPTKLFENAFKRYTYIRKDICRSKNSQYSDAFRILRVPMREAKCHDLASIFHDIEYEIRIQMIEK
jgi:hypothetical protein